MWKPGTEKPKKKEPKKPTVGSITSSDGLAQNKSPPSVKKLSTGTMNMRFMQRTTTNTTVSPKQLQSVSPEEEEDTVNDVDMMLRQVDDDEPARFALATAQDMYGTVLMGRRSFGGFRPVVEQMHQQAEAAIDNDNKKERKRKRDKKK